MREWFGRKNKAHKEEWERLHRKLDRLERQVEQLSAMREPNRITVEHLDIHNPHLENLTFRLDTLDIGDLSGVLNLGNNFSAPRSPASDRRKPSSGKTPRTPAEERSAKTPGSRPRAEAERQDGACAEQADRSGIEQTKRGYSVRIADR